MKVDKNNVVTLVEDLFNYPYTTIHGTALSIYLKSEISRSNSIKALSEDIRELAKAMGYEYKSEPLGWVKIKKGKNARKA